MQLDYVKPRWSGAGDMFWELLVEMFPEASCNHTSPEISIRYADAVGRPCSSFFNAPHVKRVLITSESAPGDTTGVDLMISFAENSSRNIHFPQMVWNSRKDWHRLRTYQRPVGPEVVRRQFCTFVYSNPQAQERIRFLRYLQQYKSVDCPGRVANNMPVPEILGSRSGDWVAGKLAFLAHYKFTIAFENVSSYGYTTEKIMHPLMAGSIPIYWGNPDIESLFNPKSFINAHRFDSFESLSAYVRHLDMDNNAYLKMMKENPFEHPYWRETMTRENIQKQFQETFSRLLAQPYSIVYRWHDMPLTVELSMLDKLKRWRQTVKKALQ